MNEKPKSVLQPVTPEVVAEARAIIAGADHAALAVLEPGTGHPLVSRVGLATLADGSPLIIVSGLTAHAKALAADPRCSLLVGEAGKGEPLAHPRISLICRAEALPALQREEARARYLARHPKAAVYVDLPDFRFLRLAVERASFNGGFGRAYEMSGAELVEP
ncbi:MAG TPA: pyridoxamine 5'-phosphate oxidase family protein [Devosia sp.]|nr:pyridoxamine 5'-phosphate oxidase family protein [Devosia sp.]